jgi:hypothetical protein
MPLQGDFEVQSAFSFRGWREVQLLYAGLRILIAHDLAKLTVEEPNRTLRTVRIEPPLELAGDFIAYRLAVQNGTYRVYANGRLLLEERLPENPDPWLALYVPSRNTGTAIDLKINGKPVIPESVAMSQRPDLTGWLAGYYGESIDMASSNTGRFRGNANQANNNAAWTRRGEEIVGRKLTDAPGSKQESLLQYHRPLVEDGTLEYEFFYDPDKAMTYLALDRLVFLLRPEGVKIHWLTDAQYDRTGRTPDNETEEAANRRGPAKLPLKGPGWNHLKLTLSGLRATLFLNGEAIYERPLENTNQRMFGLFHYADEAEVRVRNVKYTGQWLKNLPSDLLARRTGQASPQ